MDRLRPLRVRSWPVLACALLTWLLMGLMPNVPATPTRAGMVASQPWTDQFPSGVLPTPYATPEAAGHGSGVMTPSGPTREVVVAAAGSGRSEVVPTAPDQPPARFGIFPFAELVEPAPTYVPIDSAIQVSFSRAMARKSVEEGFRIKPDAQGGLKWVDEKTLRFEPVKLAYQTTYEVQVSGVTALGEPLRGTASWTFTTQKPVTITLDDCATESELRTILSVLAERRLKAMMFANGWCAAKYPWLVPAMLAGGHQVCNHTYSHPRLTRLTDAQITTEIKTGNLSRNCDWMKPPFDDWDGPGGRVERIARSLGYRILVYDIDTLDWQGLSADEMQARIRSRGGFVSMHFWGPHTIELLRRMSPP